MNNRNFQHMKRRDALKTITAAGSGLLFALPDQLSAAETGFTAKSVRGLIKKDGKSWQPIEVFFSVAPANGSTIKVDGMTEAQPVPAGEQQVVVLVPAVSSERTATVQLNSAGTTSSVPVKLKPVRRLLVYVLPHSHHDLGYTDLQANVEQKQIRNIDLGIELARKTAGYPEGARFV
jgi:alpha-mannosidase